MDNIGIQLIHAIDGNAHAPALLLARRGIKIPQVPNPGPHQRKQLRVNEFRQMQQRCLAQTHKIRKVSRFQGRQIHAQIAIKNGTMMPVETVEHGHHMPALIFGHLTTLIHQGAYRGLPEKFNEIIGIGKPPGNPDKLGETVIKPGGKFYADPHHDPHDGSGLKQFGRGFRSDKIIIDHPQAPDTLDPGIHNQVSGGFPAFGVGIVHMIIKSKLVPFFGHFQKMIFPQIGTHDAGLAHGHQPEIMGQDQLPVIVSAGPDQILHDFNQNPAGV